MNATSTAQSGQSQRANDDGEDVQSESPWAMSVQTITIAMQRARPTRMRPSRSSRLSGRNAQLSPSMSSGATIQLTTSENARWYQILRSEKSRTSAVGDTRQRMGHIIRIKAMAEQNQRGQNHVWQDVPSGKDTLTNCTFSSTTDVFGTK